MKYAKVAAIVVAAAIAAGVAVGFAGGATAASKHKAVTHHSKSTAHPEDNNPGTRDVGSTPGTRDVGFTG